MAKVANVTGLKKLRKYWIGESVPAKISLHASGKSRDRYIQYPPERARMRDRVSPCAKRHMVSGKSTPATLPIEFHVHRRGFTSSNLKVPSRASRLNSIS